MAIEITARHMDASEGMQDYARRRAEALVEAFPKVEHVHVILNVEKHRNIAEVVVQAKGHSSVGAAEASDSLIASVDRAMEKVERQLGRLRDKIHDHKPAMKREELGHERGG